MGGGRGRVGGDTCKEWSRALLSRYCPLPCDAPLRRQVSLLWLNLSLAFLRSVRARLGRFAAFDASPEGRALAAAAATALPDEEAARRGASTRRRGAPSLARRALRRPRLRF